MKLKIHSKNQFYQQTIQFSSKKKKKIIKSIHPKLIMSSRTTSLINLLLTSYNIHTRVEIIVPGIDSADRIYDPFVRLVWNRASHVPHGVDDSTLSLVSNWFMSCCMYVCAAHTRWLLKSETWARWCISTSFYYALCCVIPIVYVEIDVCLIICVSVCVCAFRGERIRELSHLWYYDSVSF